VSIGPDAQEQPSEEEVRAYLAQLRQANVGEIIAQAFSMLASGAEVKLGRRDARLLIDTTAAVVGAAKDALDERIVEQMNNAVNQLRLAQVDAEKQLQKMRDEGQIPDEDEQGDLGTTGAAPTGGDDAPRSEKPQTSKLRTPGR
jgi:murein L,D-transpeptidase YcbB/YkuD